jgi:hypothetical protein
MNLGDVANDSSAFGTLVDYINDILGATGSSFKLTDVDPDNFMFLLGFIAKQFGEGTEEDVTEDSAEVAPEVPAEVAPEMSLSKQVSELTKKLLKLEKDAEKRAKDGFEARVNDLVTAGSILPSKKASLLEAGREGDYNLSLLTGFGKSFAPNQKTPKPVVEEKKALSADDYIKMFGLKI